MDTLCVDVIMITSVRQQKHNDNNNNNNNNITTTAASRVATKHQKTALVEDGLLKK
jgi:hypothetical protein